MTDQRELGTPSRTVGLDYCRLSAFKPLTISTYNVRTLFQLGKTDQLFTGCVDAGVDIVGIQEHRLITPNPTEELWSDDRNWVLVYGSATQQRQGGVGILLSKSIYKCLQRVEAITERILFATFHGNPQLSITVVYAPTECAPSAAKEDFYTSLADHLDQVKRHNIHLILGDFNARVGVDSHVAHPVIVGRHCFHDSTNDNGERLVNLCQETQSPTRTTKISTATLSPVDLDAPIWIKTPTGPHTDQQQVGQLSSKLPCLQFSRTGL